MSKETPTKPKLTPLTEKEKQKRLEVLGSAMDEGRDFLLLTNERPSCTFITHASGFGLVEMLNAMLEDEDAQRALMMVQMFKMRKAKGKEGGGKNER